MTHHLSILGPKWLVTPSIQSKIVLSHGSDGYANSPQVIQYTIIETDGVNDQGILLPSLNLLPCTLTETRNDLVSILPDNLHFKSSERMQDSVRQVFAS